MISVPLLEPSKMVLQKFVWTISSRSQLELMQMVTPSFVVSSCIMTKSHWRVSAISKCLTRYTSVLRSPWYLESQKELYQQLQVSPWITLLTIYLPHDTDPTILCQDESPTMSFVRQGCLIVSLGWDDNIENTLSEIMKVDNSLDSLPRAFTLMDFIVHTMMLIISSFGSISPLLLDTI